MTQDSRLKEDIAYIRAAAEQPAAIPAPAIHFLWAVLGLVGFGLVDFVDEQRWIGMYWAFAAPIGFALSVWFGRRAQRNAGRLNREAGVRQSLHWLAFMAAGVLGLALVQTGNLTWRGFGSLWVLLLALTHFQAGLHIEHRLLPVGLLMGGGFLVTLWVPGLGWTVTGVLYAIALIAAGFWGAPQREATDGS